MVSILGWIVETLDNTFHGDTFLLADPKKGRGQNNERQNSYCKQFTVLSKLLSSMLINWVR